MITQKQRVSRSSRISKQEFAMSEQIIEYYHLESYSQMVRFLIHKAFQDIQDGILRAEKTVNDVR